MLTHLREIARVKGSKAKNAANIKEISKETAELKRLQVQTEKVKVATEKLAQEQSKSALAATKAANAQELSARKLLIAEETLQQQKNKTALSTIRLEEANKRQAAAAQKAEEKAKRQNDAYGQLSKRHQELKREAQNLAAALGTDSKQFQAAAAAANKLDVQLKTIDAKMGDHRRNVGNYASAWNGLNNVLGQFGIALSVGAVFEGLKSSVVSFVEAEKHAHALEFAVKNVGNEGEIAFKKLIKQSEELQANGGIFSDDEIQGAQTQLVNYGLLSDEVEVLMPKILDLATAQGVDLATATDTVIKGINGQTKGLKTVGLGFNDTGSRAENYSIILDKLTKFEGASAAAATTTEGKYKVLMNRFDDLKEDIGEFLINEGSRYLNFWDVLNGKIDANVIAMNTLAGTTSDALDPIVQKALDAAKATDSFSEKQKILTDTTIGLVQSMTLYKTLRDEAIKKGDQDEIDARNAQIEGIERQIAVVKEYQATLNNVPKSQGGSETFDDRTGDSSGDGSGNDKKTGRSSKKEEEELYKARKERRYKLIELDRQEAADHEQQVLDNIEARRKENEDIKDAQEEMEFELWKEQQEANKRAEEEAKRHQEEMIGQIERFGEKAINAATAKAERELGIMRGQINDQEKMVDIQRQRAMQGQENTLAFEEKKKADMERDAIRQEQKIRKIKQSEAYWELLAAFAKTDGDQAAQKAALEIAEGIAITALFGEKGGMGEDLKDTTTLKNGDWSKTHGSGDMLTMISPKEGILTEQNIAALGGKEGFYDLKYNLDKMGANPISDDVFEKQNSSFMNVQLQKADLNTSTLEKKLDRIVDAIESKPVASGSVDGLGNYLYKLEKKNSTLIIDKGRFVNPRRSKFIN